MDISPVVACLGFCHVSLGAPLSVVSVHSNMTITVAELIEKLKSAPPDAEVRLAHSSGCAYDDARSVEIDPAYPDFIYISTEETEEEV